MLGMAAVLRAVSEYLGPLELRGMPATGFQRPGFFCFVAMVSSFSQSVLPVSLPRASMHSS